MKKDQDARIKNIRNIVSRFNEIMSRDDTGKENETLNDLNELEKVIADLLNDVATDNGGK